MAERNERARAHTAHQSAVNITTGVWRMAAESCSGVGAAGSAAVSVALGVGALVSCAPVGAAAASGSVGVVEANGGGAPCSSRAASGAAFTSSGGFAAARSASGSAWARVAGGFWKMKCAAKSAPHIATSAPISKLGASEPRAAGRSLRRHSAHSPSGAVASPWVEQRIAEV
ncbi:MAG: hypothetical protein QM756_28465 [Polyangiaceae bacterium]